MSVNRLALLRYLTIDRCLRDHSRQWTLEDLITQVSDALYAHEGLSTGVGKRTIQQDIQVMRSDDLGYNAPIMVLEKKYYVYSDTGYSITRTAMSDKDVGMLSEAIGLLSLYEDFDHFAPLRQLAILLRDHLAAANGERPPSITIDSPALSLDISAHREAIYSAIEDKKSLKLTLHIRPDGNLKSASFHPYHLKEYNGRWHVIGRWNDSTEITALALDHIRLIGPSTSVHIPAGSFAADEYYRHAIGIERPDRMPVDIEVRCSRRASELVSTRPMHHSQRVLSEKDGALTINLRLLETAELVEYLISYGNDIEVLAPASLRAAVAQEAARLAKTYE